MITSILLLSCELLVSVIETEIGKKNLIVFCNNCYFLCDTLNDLSVSRTLAFFYTELFIPKIVTESRYFAAENSWSYLTSMVPKGKSVFLEGRCACLRYRWVCYEGRWVCLVVAPFFQWLDQSRKMAGWLHNFFSG